MVVFGSVTWGRRAPSFIKEKSSFRLTGAVAIAVLLVLFGFAQSRNAPEILVKFRPEVQPQIFSQTEIRTRDSQLNRLLRQLRPFHIEPFVAHSTKNHPFAGIFKIIPTTGTNGEKVLRELNRHSGVVWAEPNHVYHLHGTSTNDSLFSHQWALSLTGVTRAWEIQQGNPNIIVGVIDTGVDYWHEDLQGQYWVNSAEDLNGNGLLDAADLNGVDDDGNGYVDDVIGWDFTDAPNFPDNGDYRDPDNDPMDEYPGGHGTSVAGIIAARANNGKGIAGVAPGSRFMILRAGTAAGFLEEDDIAEAILYAVDNGCRIVNMSFGDVAYSHLIKDAVDYGTSRGVLFVASAGNAGNFQLQFPAAYDNTISVGATDSLNNLAGFSSYGAKVDLTAPGANLYSTRVGDEYARVSGTSFSAPMVSGALALIWSREPDASAATVRSRLLASCRDFHYFGWDPYYGHGVLDVYAAVTSPLNAQVNLQHPATLTGLRNDTVQVQGTALSSQLKEYSLSFATGELPLDFQPITSVSQQVYQSNLGTWNIAALPDTTYVLQLKVTNWDGSEVVHNTVVEVDRTAPTLVSQEVLPIVVEDQSGYLIRLETDDRTMAYFMYRQVGESEFSSLLSSAYFARRHTFLITPEDVSGQIEYYLEFRNASGLTSREDNHGQYYQLDLTGHLPLSVPFRMVLEQPGFGYFLDRGSDFDQNGAVELVAYAAWPDAPEARLSTVSFSNGTLTHHAASIPAFPRDISDVDGDQIPELFAGYGPTSYLFPGSSLPQFSTPPTQVSEQDFWVGRVFYVAGYSHPHILALHQGNWQIYLLMNSATFEVAPLQTLENPTSGENSYGVPHALVGFPIFDHIMRIVVGDYDGDVLVYRIDGNDQFTLVSHKRLPGVDATHQLAWGDLDGDGNLEVVVATKHQADYVGESSVLDQFWYLTILNWLPDDSLNVIYQAYFHGLHDEKGVFNGLTVSDYDGDGRDEIFFTPYPNGYYIQYEQGEWRIDGYFRGVNSVSVPKIDSGEFLLVGDSTLMVWQLESSGQRPATPGEFRILDADTNRVVLTWQPVSGARAYLVNRQGDNGGFAVQFSVVQPPWTDSTVTAGATYRYTVQAVDTSFTDSLSLPTMPLTVQCIPPPALIGSSVAGSNQLILEFSGPLHQQSFRVNHFYLMPEGMIPTSVVRGKSAAQMLLSFPTPMQKGRHILYVAHLTSSQGIPLFRDTLLVPLLINWPENPPYLKQARVINRKQILLEFDRAMDKSSVENPENYLLEPDDRVVAARQDSVRPAQVWLTLTGRNRMGSLGVDYYITVRNVLDAQGIPIQTGVGDRLVLREPVNDLSKLLVFPNPFKPEYGQNEITFGNVPVGCEIFIYSASGQLVQQLREEDSNGGVAWNLCNQQGRKVNSGVYIYIARFQGEKKTGKFVILK